MFSKHKCETPTIIHNDFTTYNFPFFPKCNIKTAIFYIFIEFFFKLKI